MSTPPPPPDGPLPPPDRPTERLQPQPPPQYEGAAQYEGAPRPGVPVAGDPALLFARLEDTISSLRTMVAVVGVIAVVALGLGLYAVLREDSSSSTPSDAASSDEVARLDERVDSLSRQVQDLRSSSGDTSALDDRIDDLSKEVDTLKSASSETEQAVKDLEGRVDDLSSQVEELGQGQTPP